MTAKKTTPVKPEHFDLFTAAISAVPGIELKGATMPYASLNGNMFSFLSKEGTAGIRLPEEQRAEFLKKYKTTLVDAHGVVMKQYASVPGKLLKNPAELRPWLIMSHDYAKPSKKK